MARAHIPNVRAHTPRAQMPCTVVPSSGRVHLPSAYNSPYPAQALVIMLGLTGNRHNCPAPLDVWKIAGFSGAFSPGCNRLVGNQGLPSCEKPGQRLTRPPQDLFSDEQPFHGSQILTLLWYLQKLAFLACQLKMNITCSHSARPRPLTSMPSSTWLCSWCRSHYSFCHPPHFCFPRGSGEPGLSAGLLGDKHCGDTPVTRIGKALVPFEEKQQSACCLFGWQ